MKPIDATCQDLERGLSGESPEWVARVEAHARGCADCAQQLADWRQLSAMAPSLQRQWDSPGLWPRISEALVVSAQPQPALVRWLRSAQEVLRRAWQRAAAGLGQSRMTLAAVAVVALVTGGVAGRPVVTWLLGGGESVPDEWRTAQALESYPLLTERAVAEVESAERQYEAAIGRLSSVVQQPKVASARSPLLESYREKLALLDSAIAELRAGIEENRRNSHLRRELLAMYREKQQTLNDMLRASQP